MSVTELVDPAFMTLMRSLANELIGYTPEHYKTAFCVVEQAPRHNKGRLQYRIGSRDYPNEWTDRPSPGLHNAAYELYRHWTHGGEAFPGAEIKVEKQPDGNWRSSVSRLDAQRPVTYNASDEAEERRWQEVYQTRDAFFTKQFGPVPDEIKKLLNLMGIWPGGGMWQMEAPRMGGRGVCVTCGLSNVDMPTPVQIAQQQQTPRQGNRGPGVSTQLKGRTPCWIHPDLAGYGYEVAVLTPAPESWPLLPLSWLIQMEILNDLRLLDRVKQDQGVTVESVKIGDGSRSADFLIQPAVGPLPEQVPLPNGAMHLLIATRITRDEMEFSFKEGRVALLERLHTAGVGQMSILDRPSVVA